MEYRVVSKMKIPMGEPELNAMALDRWKLVTIIRHEISGGASGVSYYHYFERPKVEELIKTA